MSNGRFVNLKVCGMRDPDNILDVAALQPDYLGFIFFKGSPRFVGKDFKIPDGLSASIERVGVFVNAPLEDVLKYSQRHSLTHVQLHGNESVDQCGELKSLGLKVIKAIGIAYASDFDCLVRYVPVIDYFLFDTKSPGLGGSGRRFEWGMLSHYRHQTPFFLSGGIGPANVHKLRDYYSLPLTAIDVNSIVEIQPGLKDVNRVRAVQEIISKRLVE